MAKNKISNGDLPWIFTEAEVVPRLRAGSFDCDRAN
jgi:hypothetical protein